ncbi:MAG TPA: thioredoxin family protein [Spirochaetia bacterium]|nr:thioredoxin family protein [Spirochaetia bacterium]
MKRYFLLTGALLALAMAGWGQDMGGSSGTGSGMSSGSDAGSMMAPADTMNGDTTMKGGTDSMMAAPNAMSGSNTMKGSTDSMMMAAMDYDTLKKEGKLADTKMGMQLRSARSTGMKSIYKDLMASERLAAKGPTVLFFAADWCPSCQADLKDINANGSRLGAINVVVVDYDRSSDLKKKYGITVQDSFVQIGAMGEKLAAWNGGGVDGILMNVQKAM